MLLKALLRRKLISLFTPLPPKKERKCCHQLLILMSFQTCMTFSSVEHKIRHFIKSYRFEWHEGKQ